MTDEWNRLKKARAKTAYALSVLMSDNVPVGLYLMMRGKHSEACRNIVRYQRTAEAVSQVCVTNNLPGGSPPWMCRELMSYIKNE
jgi:hypothetical protein